MNKQSKEYKQYMKSDEWEQKRQERIAIDQGCVMCGRPRKSKVCKCIMSLIKI